ncbi:hypothetical protein T4D_7391 [Trichinella pseudospiralis]|uniref:Uncharacterized protein n=1 Tax=Trichinella pseudospiralis TaxID=6337 RepID=A0A0V1FZX6_TRIPS|nr:hypothetical protein T4D_7391 [Trichinella pseudospiralis]
MKILTVLLLNYCIIVILNKRGISYPLEVETLITFLLSDETIYFAVPLLLMNLRHFYFTLYYLINY